MRVSGHYEKKKSASSSDDVLLPTRQSSPFRAIARSCWFSSSKWLHPRLHDCVNAPLALRPLRSITNHVASFPNTFLTKISSGSRDLEFFSFLEISRNDIWDVSIDRGNFWLMRTMASDALRTWADYLVGRLGKKRDFEGFFWKILRRAFFHGKLMEGWFLEKPNNCNYFLISKVKKFVSNWKKKFIFIFHNFSMFFFWKIIFFEIVIHK